MHSPFMRGLCAILLITQSFSQAIPEGNLHASLDGTSPRPTIFTRLDSDQEENVTKSLRHNWSLGEQGVSTSGPCEEETERRSTQSQSCFYRDCNCAPAYDAPASAEATEAVQLVRHQFNSVLSGLSVRLSSKRSVLIGIFQKNSEYYRAVPCLRPPCTANLCLFCSFEYDLGSKCRQI